MKIKHSLKYRRFKINHNLITTRPCCNLKLTYLCNVVRETHHTCNEVEKDDREGKRKPLKTINKTLTN